MRLRKIWWIPKDLKNRITDVTTTQNKTIFLSKKIKKEIPLCFPVYYHIMQNSCGNSTKKRGNIHNDLNSTSSGHMWNTRWSTSRGKSKISSSCTLARTQFEFSP